MTDSKDRQQFNRSKGDGLAIMADAYLAENTRDLNTPKFDRATCFTACRARGVARVSLSFSGGNDEGRVDVEHYQDADGNEVQLEREVYPYLHGAEKDQLGWTEYPDSDKPRWEDAIFHPATEQQLADMNLRALCEQPIYDKYHSFAGEFYVEGVLEIDVEAEQVRMKVSEQVSEWVSSEETV